MGVQKRVITEQKRPQTTPQGGQNDQQRKWMEKPKNNPQQPQKPKVNQDVAAQSNKPQAQKQQVNQAAANPQKPVRPERFVNQMPMDRQTAMNNFEKDNADLESTREDIAEFGSNTSSPNSNQNDQKDETPQDWLKPKIFKGGGFI